MDDFLINFKISAGSGGIPLLSLPLSSIERRKGKWQCFVTHPLQQHSNCDLLNIAL